MYAQGGCSLDIEGEGTFLDDSPGFWVLFVSLFMYLCLRRGGPPNSSSCSVDPEAAEVSRRLEEGEGFAFRTVVRC